MPTNITDMVQHFAVLARPRDIALGIATRMVTHAGDISDFDALRRWGRLYSELQQDVDPAS